ncbi:uncharacterized protein FIBRA_08557 [Fibroporia radiculosa]|uniref:Uncharacterized protein n=1 Tax=Fibroporia radiculosa TaxID=599839 RepID=J4ICF2_9APHY|nr:uncharacterized protein FIBRA_08557 [Fibroporia radiculosa]CCM06306.1 predicted protein [Fibroporia radiculosa]
MACGQDVGLANAVSDALALVGLDGLATLSVPVQAAGDWAGRMGVNPKSTYETSAVLATHIESATVPLRLKDSGYDLGSMCGALNCDGSMRFAHLSGVFPLDSPLEPERDFKRRLYDFSSLPSGATERLVSKRFWARVGLMRGDRQDTRLEYARMYVARGFSSSDRGVFERWSEGCRPMPYRIFAPAYPIPTSFPHIVAPTAVSPPRRPYSAPTVGALASVHTGADTARLFGGYAALVEDVGRRKPEVLAAVGLEGDEVEELRDALWELRDGYAGGEDGGGDEELGEDEE